MAKAKIDMSNVPDEFKSETGRYKPGHDAKHVSHILEGLKNDAKSSGQGKIKITAMREAQKELPTPALREKLQKAVERFNNPAEKKPRAPRAEKPAPEPEVETEAEPNTPQEIADESDVVRYEEIPDVKVGRWFYPARNAFLDGGAIQQQRNEARDGSGAWVVV